jgi:hypothetical protein
MLRRLVTIIGIAALGTATLLADFSYRETSTITGGMIAGVMKIAGAFSKQAREPVQTTVAVKGDRMVHRSQTHATVIDLAGQTITSIDLQKKTWSVMTFEEMKRMLEQMSQKVQQNDNDKGEMSFKVSADNTGKTRQVAGFDAKEMVLKMEMEGADKQSGQKGAMVITTDMWIAPGVPGYNEVREFYKRMAEKVSWTPGGNMFMANPDAAKGMAEVYKEVARLDGVPVLQYISMGAEGQPGAAPAEDGGQPAAQQPPPAERPSVGGALGGALGGRFGLGRKKSQPADQPSSQPAPSGNAAGSGSLLEMTTELASFSSNPVDDSQFAVPAGFKKVEPDTRRGMK